MALASGDQRSDTWLAAGAYADGGGGGGGGGNGESDLSLAQYGRAIRTETLRLFEVASVGDFPSVSR